MPNRILRDSIRTSRSLALLSAEEFRHFTLLLAVADDFGRFDASPEVIKGFCYPRLEGRLTVDDVDGWTKRLALDDVGILQLYEIDGLLYGSFLNWEKYQTRRAKVSKFPQPPTHDRTLQQPQAATNMLPQPQESANICDHVQTDENISNHLQTNVPVVVVGVGVVNEDVNGIENGVGVGVGVGDDPPATRLHPEPSPNGAPATTPEWLFVLENIQSQTPDDISRITDWAATHDDTALRETAYELAGKWPEVRTRYANLFSAFQSWVRRTESDNGQSRSPPELTQPVKKKSRQEIIADFATEFAEEQERERASDN